MIFPVIINLIHCKVFLAKKSLIFCRKYFSSSNLGAPNLGDILNSVLLQRNNTDLKNEIGRRLHVFSIILRNIYEQLQLKVTYILAAISILLLILNKLNLKMV